MNYNSISSKAVIAKLDHDFSIPVSNWITSAPTWIADALDEMDLITTFEDVQMELNIENNHAQLPDGIMNGIERLDAVSYEGYLLANTIFNKNKHSYNTTSTTYHPSETFTIRNGYIITSFEEGKIIIYYKRAKIEYDEEQMIYYPFVPDNSHVINAIEYYLMFCILRKGHKIIGQDLESKNRLSNPYLMWNELKDDAKNNINALDPEERRELSRQYRTFIVNHQLNQNLNISTVNPNANTQQIAFGINPYKFNP